MGRTLGSGRTGALPTDWVQVELAGITTDLLEVDAALGLILEYATARSDETLGVVSINLDHLHHFGLRGSLDSRARDSLDFSVADGVRWLTLLDGAPLVKKAGKLTGRPWPRLAGSDLIEPILDRANESGLSVGFLGGSPETHRLLGPVIAERWPNVRIAGFWAPDRSDLEDESVMSSLTEEIRAAQVDLLAVCLGKPRQERWIAKYGRDSGAHVCLAFGAVVDFLAGRVNRAPRWISDRGLEWLWRLAKEPRRLARRYLIQGPPAYRALQTNSSSTIDTPNGVEVASPSEVPTVSLGRFVGAGVRADIAVIVVTYNNVDEIDPLIDSLREQASDQRIRLVIADNNSSDGTVEKVAEHSDVALVATGGNLGYSGGINAARSQIGPANSVLVLNPDLVVLPGALQNLSRRLAHGAVKVAVPQLLDPSGEVYTSIRREPSLTRALGDALLGERLGGRPGSLSEVVLDQRQYRCAHTIDWATGAALLVDTNTFLGIGEWDERFFLYSEEIDFFRRVRDSGGEVWYEPSALMQHMRGGSGSSEHLYALLEVNRVRYQEKLHGRLRSVPFRAVTVLRSLLRLNQPGARVALRYLLDRSLWSDLPHASESILRTEA